MRLDVFLKISRLVPRRSLAQQFCDAGLIEVNGSKAKSSKEIKAGDEVKISRRNRKALIRVDSVPDKKQLSKELASEFYTVLSEEAVDDLA